MHKVCLEEFRWRGQNIWGVMKDNLFDHLLVQVRGVGFSPLYWTRTCILDLLLFLGEFRLFLWVNCIFLFLLLPLLRSLTVRKRVFKLLESILKESAHFAHCLLGLLSQWFFLGLLTLVLSPFLLLLERVLHRSGTLILHSLLRLHLLLYLSLADLCGSCNLPLLCFPSLFFLGHDLSIFLLLKLSLHFFS